MLKSYFVYILQCSDGTYYTGITNNLERRIREHEQGINKEAYTHNRRPVELVWHERYSDPELAIAVEK